MKVDAEYLQHAMWRADAAAKPHLRHASCMSCMLRAAHAPAWACRADDACRAHAAANTQHACSTPATPAAHQVCDAGAPEVEDHHRGQHRTRLAPQRAADEGAVRRRAVALCKLGQHVPTVVGQEVGARNGAAPFGTDKPAKARCKTLAACSQMGPAAPSAQAHASAASRAMKGRRAQGDQVPRAAQEACVVGAWLQGAAISHREGLEHCHEEEEGQAARKACGGCRRRKQGVRSFRAERQLLVCTACGPACVRVGRGTARAQGQPCHAWQRRKRKPIKPTRT